MVVVIVEVTVTVAVADLGGEMGLLLLTTFILQRDWIYLFPFRVTMLNTNSPSCCFQLFAFGHCTVLFRSSEINSRRIFESDKKNIGKFAFLSTSSGKPKQCIRFSSTCEHFHQYLYTSMGSTLTRDVNQRFYYTIKKG